MLQLKVIVESSPSAQGTGLHVACHDGGWVARDAGAREDYQAQEHDSK